MTQIRQPTQVFNSETYDDQSTISQAAFEPASGASNIQVDLNNLRTQVNNILSALNGDWYDNPFAGGGGAGGTNDIPISGDPSVQVSLNTIPIACFADVLTDVTVGAGNNFVVLDVAGSEAPSQPGSLSNDTEGVIVAESALSGAPWETNELTERAGSSDIAPNNLVTVRDATTLQPIQSSGRDVFALIQVENGFANGAAFTDVTPQRVKLSFVRINAAGNDLEACPVADIENQTINYNYPFVQYFKNIDPSCFTGSRSFVDQAASVDVTLQNAYVGGNTITTSVGEGNVTITGDQDFIVSGSVDVDVDTTGAVSIDADAASNLTVDGAQLDVATTTSGDINVSSAGVLNLDSATQTDVQSAGGAINVGTDAVATSITVGNITGATAVAITGGTGTHSIATQNAATAGAIVTLDNGGSTIGLFAGSGDPNGIVNAGGNVGSLYAETSGGQLWVNTDGATTWVQFGSAAAVTLEQATQNTGASPAVLGGTSGATTFETQIQDGNTMSWETTASEELLAVVADAGGDIVRIGNGTGDTLDVNTAAVDIDTNGYSMVSTGAFLVRGETASTVETTGAAAPLVLQTTGAGSAINIQTTDTTSSTNTINITAADNASGAGNSVNINSGASTGGLSRPGGQINLVAGNGGPSAGTGGTITATAGSGGATGVGGAVTIDAGAGGTTSGDGGALTLTGGGATDGAGGPASLFGGSPAGGNNAGGAATVSAGVGQGTGNGGNASLAGGLAAGNGNGGDAIISGGDVAGVGSGGDIIGTAGDSGGANVGGSVSWTGGAGSGSGSGGFVTLTGGVAGVNGDGGNVDITGGAGGATSGAGGFLRLSAGDGTTLGAGGEIILQSGAAAGAADNGTIRLRTAAGASVSEEDEVVQLANLGTGTGGGSTITQYVIESDPSVVGITANVGSIAFRNVTGADTTGEAWLKTGSTDTDWTQLQAGGGNNLQQAYVAGNTITTSAPEGPLDVSGTEAISLDAGAASNFSVAGASLTLETTGAANTIMQSEDFVLIGSQDVSGVAFAGGTVITSAGVTAPFPPLAPFATLPTNTASAPVVVQTGTTTGTGVSGVVSIESGSSVNGDSGGITITTGATLAGAGSTGPALLRSGNAGSGNSGQADLRTGSSISGDTGIATVATGNATAGASGNATMNTGTGETTGSISIFTANATVGTAGTVSITAGNAAGAATPGAGVTITAGDASGSGLGGSYTSQAGDADTTGIGGIWTANAGDGGSTSGAGGSAVINAGNALGGDSLGGGVDINAGAGSGNSAGGSVSIDSGDGGATGNAGAIAVVGGDGGATSGGGGNLVFQGGGSTNGAAGNITIAAGSSTTTGAAGSVTIQSGGSGNSTAGLVTIQNTNTGHDEDDPVLLIQNSGINGEAFNVFSGTSVPTVNTITGSLWVRDDGTTGELYINTSAGGSGTTWTQLQAGGGNSLQQAYVQGNTIVTDAANGDVDISGTEDFLVDMDGIVDIRAGGTGLTVINDNQSGTGSALFGTGTTTGGPNSGAVTLASGDGASGGSASGQVAVRSGFVTGGAGATGPVFLQSGNNTGTGTTGSVTVTTGTSTNSTAGAISVAPGNSNAGAGALLTLAGGQGSTTGGNVTIDGGASSGTGNGGDVLISGGAPNSGAGGNVQLTGADGLGTNENGGDVILVPGLATGTGTTGVVQIDSAADVDDIMLRFDRSGSQPSISDMYIGQDAPVFTAKAGSLYLQNDQLNTDGGAVWVQRDASGASATGNDWEELVTSSGALARTLVQGVANANITAGNDVSNDAPAANVTMDFGSFPTFPTPQAAFNTRVQVWVNGVLQRNGVTVTLGTNATDLQFNFQIFSGDIIQIQQWSA